jgi:hypothetical protein
VASLQSEVLLAHNEPSVEEVLFGHHVWQQVILSELAKHVGITCKLKHTNTRLPDNAEKPQLKVMGEIKKRGPP